MVTRYIYIQSRSLMAGVESLGEGGTIGKINTGSVANYAKVGPAGTPRVPIAFRVGEAGRISRFGTN